MSEALQALYGGDRERGERLLPPDIELSVFEAAAFGRSGRLSQILDADPSQVADRLDGFTPLHLAVFGGSADACRLLIRHGADVDAISDGGAIRVCPLGTATFVRSVDLARLLLGTELTSMREARETSLPFTRRPKIVTSTYAACSSSEVRILRLSILEASCP